MSESIKMPALGESVTEGTVSTWLKSVGDTIEVDEPLLEVSTDKVDTEVPSPVAGVLLEILVEEDETVEVGTELARVGDPDEASSSDNSSSDDAAAAPAEAEQAEQAAPADDAPADDAEEPKAEASGSSGAPSGEVSGEEVAMPALGESVTEGTVSAWLKQVGDEVEADEPLLEVSTDKVDTEVPSPVSGTLLKILVEEDETVEVGTALAVIGDGSAAPAESAPAEDKAKEPKEEPKEEAKEEPKEEPKAASPAEAPAKPAPAEHAPTPAEAPAPEKKSSSSEAGYVTPIVRKLAKDKGVDLAEVTGTGVGGRIRKQDVIDAAEKKAAAASAAAPAAPAAAAAGGSASGERRTPTVAKVDTELRGTTQKMSRLRQVISERMTASLDTSAQLTTVVEVDVTRVAKLRAAAKDGFASREGTKLTFLPFFVKAATEALKAHPKVNATINGKEVTYHDHEHIGIAVDTERGLLVPVIKNAGDLNMAGIAKSINELAAKTRDNKVSPDDLSGSTFTITNTGSGGALFDTPIINQPEVAILGVGTIVKRPMVVKDAEGNETIGIRSMVYLALTYDHRLVDGADAARYLMTVKARLEEGAFESEIGL